jgi:hypothetical protein
LAPLAGRFGGAPAPIGSARQHDRIDRAVIDLAEMLVIGRSKAIGACGRTENSAAERRITG